MATIKPFSAVRPKKGLEDKIAALPYDVYNRAEAKEAVKDNPLSFLNIDRPETAFPDDTDMYADFVYKKAREMFENMLAEGSYIQEEAPYYYLYELTMNGRSQTGFVGCAGVDDYINEVIKKHENTRADKEADRIRHVDALDAQTGPIFLAYRYDEALDSIKKSVKESKEALYDFTSEDGIRHRVWVVDDESMIENIAEAFAKMNQIYIADGHHRCASAVKVSLMRREANPQYTGGEEYNYFLSVLFSEDELAIFDYNRVVKDLNGYSDEEFLGKIAENFSVEKTAAEALEGSSYRPRQKGEFGMYLSGQWYVLKVKPELVSEDVVERLDVSLLQNYLLSPVLGIADPKTDKRIDFVGGIRGLSELERRCGLDCKVAFSMYPTTITELFDVADAARLMPPKSTWFEPKLRSGIFIHKI